ncbi:TonB-dependent receptor [Rubrivirga litoralis]|uniref:TonB-dependent receptor n=1 Tax=Rubrivirga litoralis TaxID=3075598 RepID=A0ABU3BNP7_9BACT|nr:TonB-dependent receptor [Rubrivirga sp. F394]MDT0630912.1 TonB-dependent receptor [Rubrivirga sp. F394]
MLHPVLSLIPIPKRFRLRGACALAFCAVALFGVQSAYAQSVLRGTVIDSLSGGTLPGANVLVQGTALGAATDIEGTYRVSNIPAGDYTVRFSYVGYETRFVPVSIADGQTVMLDVALQLSGGLGEVVVSGQAEGQQAAINQQLSSNTIVNVVSEEKIQELPDANAAESIGRLPGVSVQRSGGEANQIVLRGLSGAFTNVTVDGISVAATGTESRSVDLSAISQGTLSGIELFKALTPDKDADAIAGSVNLVTRRAPRDRQIRVNALGSYNGLASDVGQYDTDVRYGERFWGDRLGVQITANLERRNRSNEEYDVGYDKDVNEEGTTTYLLDDLDLSYTDETRRRRGAGAILDVDTPDGGFVKLSTLYNHTSRDFIVSSRNYPASGADELFYSARDREQTISLLTGALTGETYFLGLESTWGLSYARSSTDNPFDYELVFTEPSATDSDGNVIAGTQVVPKDVREGDPEDLIPFAVNNFESAYLYGAFFQEEESSDTDLSAYLNLRRDYTFGSSIGGQIKVGGKYRDKSRTRDQSEVISPYYVEAFPGYVQLADGSVVPKDFAGTMFDGLQRSGSRIFATNFIEADRFTEDLYGSRFTLNPVLDRDAVRAWWELNQNGVSDAAGRDPEYEVNDEARIFFYDIAERVSAGYVMNTLNIGERVTWIAGLRMEHENNDYGSRYSPTQLTGFPVPSTSSIRDTSSTFSETVWLPNTHLLIEATDFMNVRLAAYRALARPDFNQRLATVVGRQTSTFFPGNSVTLGNPNLRSARAWNYEINTSFYGPRIGLFSVSAFYKSISDYYQTINNIPYNGNEIFEEIGIDYQTPFGGNRFVLTAPFNSPRATTVYGIEVEHQTSLGFLPGLLSGFVVSYNGTLLHSETVVPAVNIETTFIERPPFPPVPQITYTPVETDQKLQEQPDFIANVALGYDYRSFSARVSMAHQGEYFTRFGDGANRDAAARGGFTRWDLAVKQAVRPGVMLLLNVNNLTGVEETRLRINDVIGRTLLNDSQIYGTTIDFGLRVDL